VWHQVECRYAPVHKETLELARIYEHDNLPPQGEIESLEIEFLDLGLGRVVQRELNSIYCGKITGVRYWRL
jgi:hypothetical protein